MNSKESVSSGVSMSSTFMSRSSGVSKKSSDSKEPSLWSRERFISGTTRVRRLRDEDTQPPSGRLTFRESGGAETRPGGDTARDVTDWGLSDIYLWIGDGLRSSVTYRLCHLWDHRRNPCLRTLAAVCVETRPVTPAVGLLNITYNNKQFIHKDPPTATWMKAEWTFGWYDLF